MAELPFIEVNALQIQGQDVLQTMNNYALNKTPQSKGAFEKSVEVFNQSVTVFITEKGGATPNEIKEIALTIWSGLHEKALILHKGGDNKGAEVIGANANKISNEALDMCRRGNKRTSVDPTELPKALVAETAIAQSSKPAI